MRRRQTGCPGRAAQGNRRGPQAADPAEAWQRGARLFATALIGGFFSDRTNQTDSAAGLSWRCSVVIFALVRRRRRRDARLRGRRLGAGAGPPADMTPALAALVAAPLDTTRAVTCALLDLAAHGHIAFYQEATPLGPRGRNQGPLRERQRGDRGRFGPRRPRLRGRSGRRSSACSRGSCRPRARARHLARPISRAAAALRADRRAAGADRRPAGLAAAPDSIRVAGLDCLGPACCRGGRCVGGPHSTRCVRLPGGRRSQDLAACLLDATAPAHADGSHHGGHGRRLPPDSQAGSGRQAPDECRPGWPTPRKPPCGATRCSGRRPLDQRREPARRPKGSLPGNRLVPTARLRKGRNPWIALVL
jgi:hypothetical protein